MGTFLNPAALSRGGESTRGDPHVIGQAARSIDLTGRACLAIIVCVWAAGVVLGFDRALTTLMTLSFVGAVAGLSYPAVGALSVAVLCALDTPARVYLLSGGLLRFNSFNYWLLVVVVVGLPFLLRLRDPHTRLFQAFVVLLGIELLISQNLTFGLQHFLNIAAPFGLLVYLAPTITSPAMWYWLGLNMGVLGAGGGLLFYLQRESLPFINPNSWALFPLTVLFTICLSIWFDSERKRGRVVLAMLTVVNSAWVFLSGSRGGLLIAVMCVAFLILIMRGVSGRLTFIVMAFVASVAVSTQFTDLQDHMLHRLDRLTNSKVSMVSRTSGRSELMRGGWSIFLGNPLGVGTGGFAPAWAQLGPELRLGFKQGQEFQSHSAWLKVLVENGLPGILLFSAYVLSFLVTGVRAPEGRRWLLGAFVTLVLVAAFGTTEFQSKGLWFLAAAATTLLHRETLVRLLRERYGDS